MLQDVPRGSQVLLDDSTLGRDRQTYEEAGIDRQADRYGRQGQCPIRLRQMEPFTEKGANRNELGQAAVTTDARGAPPISLYNYFVYSRSTAPGGCMLIIIIRRRSNNDNNKTKPRMITYHEAKSIDYFNKSGNGLAWCGKCWGTSGEYF